MNRKKYNMPSLLKSTLLYAPSIIAPRIYSYLIVIIFTRMLAPEEFGLFSLIITYGEVLDSVFSNWIRLGILRFYRSEEKCNHFGIVKLGLILHLLFAVVGLLLFGIVLLFSDNATSSLEFIFILTVYFVGNSAMRYGLNILRASEKNVAYTVLEIIRPTLSFIGIFVITSIFKVSFVSISLGYFGVTALFGIGAIVWVCIKINKVSIDWKILRPFIRYTLPLVIMFFLNSIISSTDRYMLSVLSGTAMVGMYSASNSISRPIIDLVFNAINLGAFPQLIKKYEIEGTEAAARYLELIIATLIFWGFPITAGICTVSIPFSYYMLGEQYREAAISLIPLMTCTGLVAGLKSFAFDQIFHLKQKSMVHIYILFPASILNIFINYYSIPRFGIVGAAWSTFISYLMALITTIFISKRMFIYNFPYKETAIAAISTISMTIFLSMIKSDHKLIALLIAGPIGFIVYIISSYVCGSAITKNFFLQLTIRLFKPQNIK